VLSKPSNAQLLAAIRKLSEMAMPRGAVVHGYFVVAPAGFLLANGGLISRVTFAELFAHASANSLIVSEAAWVGGQMGMFGAGDGATTFRLPDLRAEFIRAADLGRGVDAGRAVGSRQTDELRSHAHALTTVDNDESTSLGYVAESTTPVSLSASRIATSATGGAETRPRNVALAAAIKY
jgi:microcystin-dependent protein